MAGIYIHIPFCKQKCSYCNFHFSTQLSGLEEMQEALLLEIELRSEEITQNKIETIYFGGGTPSLWSAEHLFELITRIDRYSKTDALKEVTLESNPDDITIDYLKDLKNHTPINRISLGIQSFFDDDLKWMNRSHSAYQAQKALGTIFDNDWGEVSADLIFGLPHSTEDRWLENLHKITQFPVNHLSCYNLTIEDKTALKYQIQQGLVTLPDDKTTIQQFHRTREFLSELGYIHYEISNYGRPEHLAVHNTSYWKGTPYIGIGPSAHSYDGFRRRWNISNNIGYIKKIHAGDIFWENETLTENDQYNEYILTGLRTMWGVEKEKIKCYSPLIRQEFDRALKIHLRNENIKQDGQNFTLTTQGQAIADQVIADFFYL